MDVHKFFDHNEMRLHLLKNHHDKTVVSYLLNFQDLKSQYYIMRKKLLFPILIPQNHFFLYYQNYN